jgi:1-acyl-sn-glycerol-3-phosphate acyltransferase
MIAAALAGRDRARAVRGGTRACHRLARGLARVMGLRVTVQGTPPAGPVLLCPNHLSYLDILVLASVTDVLFVSRGDVAHWPFVGALARLGGTIFLDRSRRRDAARAGDDVGVWLERGFRVVVFLEGRAGPGGDVLPFRSSLLEPAVRRGVPCVGASIAYALPDDPGADVAQEVGWSDDAPFGAHVLRLLRRQRLAVVPGPRRGLEAGSQI